MEAGRPALSRIRSCLAFALILGAGASLARGGELPSIRAEWVDPPPPPTPYMRAGSPELKIRGLLDLARACLQAGWRIEGDADPLMGLRLIPKGGGDTVLLQVDPRFTSRLSITSGKQQSSRSLAVVAHSPSLDREATLLEHDFPTEDDLSPIAAWLNEQRGVLCDALEEFVAQPANLAQSEPGPTVHLAVRKSPEEGWLELRPPGFFESLHVDPNPVLGPEQLAGAEAKGRVALMLGPEGRDLIAKTAEEHHDDFLLLKLDGQFIMVCQLTWRGGVDVLPVMGSLDLKQRRRLVYLVTSRS